MDKETNRKRKRSKESASGPCCQNKSANKVSRRHHAKVSLQFPVEVWWLIFEFLDQSSLCNAIAVCRHWRDVVHRCCSKVEYKGFISRQRTPIWSEETGYLLQSYTHLCVLELGHITMWYEAIDYLPTSLRLIELTDIVWKIRSTRFTAATTWPKYLKSLSVSRSSLCKYVFGGLPSTIKHLHITDTRVTPMHFLSPESCHSPAELQSIFDKFACMQTLCISGADWEESTGDAGVFLPETLEMISWAGVRSPWAKVALTERDREEREHPTSTSIVLSPPSSARYSYLKKVHLEDSYTCDEDLLWFSYCPQLSFLDLSRTRITGSTLDQLPGASLEVLRLGGNDLVETALGHLKRFCRLHTLNLRNTGTSTSYFHHLTHLPLRDLDVAQTIVKQPSDFQWIPTGRMKCLNVSHSGFDDQCASFLFRDPSSRDQGKYLTRFFANFTAITRSILPMLPPTVKVLSLGFTRISSPFVHLLPRDLTHLSLERAEIAEEDWGRLPCGLAYFNISMSQSVKDQTLMDLGRSADTRMSTSLTTLDLSETSVTIRGLCHLSHFASLKTLYLTNTLGINGRRKTNGESVTLHQLKKSHLPWCSISLHCRDTGLRVKI